MSDGQPLSTLSSGRRVLVIGTALVVIGSGIGFAAWALRSQPTVPSKRPPHFAAQPAGHIAVAGTDRKGLIAVYTMRADGSEMTTLAGLPGYVSSVSWSPDGKRIAYDSGMGKGKSEIDVVLPDGSRRRTITSNGEPNEPAWSPDGTRIAFSKGVANGDAIAVINADGSGLRSVSTPPYACNDGSASWSPDGRKIAFYRDCASATGAPGIYEVNVDGTGQTRLLPALSQDPNEQASPLQNSVGVVFGLDWSPDGRKILFGNFQPGSEKILDTMNADGTGLRTLTNGLIPAWSPDGAFVAFVRDGALYEMSANGLAIHAIKETAGFQLTSVSWGP